MGAWKVMSRRIPELLPEGVELGYIGRPERASPGEGYSGAHAREQERIVLSALSAEPSAVRAISADSERRARVHRPRHDYRDQTGPSRCLPC